MRKLVIEKAAIRANMAVIRKRAAGAALYGVLTGDGGGAGLIPLARMLRDEGVGRFAVGSVEEAQELREAGFVEEEILMLRATVDREELERLARQDVAAARGALEDILSNYQGFRRCVVILVFDAYKVKGNPGSVERRNGIYVVYTKEAETADAYIEKTTYEIAREHRVRVVTSDGAEQLIILGHGALRLPAASFRREVEEAEGEISAILARHNRGERSRPVKEALERAAAKERSGPGSGRKR